MAESKSDGSTNENNAYSEKQPESAPSNNNRLAADSECRDDIPTEPKAFERWMNAHKADWPAALVSAANRAHLSLLTADQTAWSESYALRKAAKADWNAFTTALAAYRAEAA